MRTRVLSAALLAILPGAAAAASNARARLVERAPAELSAGVQPTGGLATTLLSPGLQLPVPASQGPELPAVAPELNAVAEVGANLVPTAAPATTLLPTDSFRPPPIVPGSERDPAPPAPEKAALAKTVADAQKEVSEAGGSGAVRQAAVVGKIFRERGEAPRAEEIEPAPTEPSGGARPALRLFAGDDDAGGAVPELDNRVRGKGDALRRVGEAPRLDRELGDKAGWARVGEFRARGRDFVVKSFAPLLRPLAWAVRYWRESIWAMRNEVMARWFLRRFFQGRLDTVDGVGYMSGLLFARPTVVMGKAQATENPYRLSSLPLATRAALGVFVQARGLSDVNPKNVLLPRGSVFEHPAVIIDMERPIQPAGTYGIYEMPWTSVYYWNRLDAHFQAEIARLREALRAPGAIKEIRRNMRKSDVRHPRRRDPLMRAIQDNVDNFEAIFEANFLAVNKVFLRSAREAGLDLGEAGIMSEINRAAAESPHGGVYRDFARMLLVAHNRFPQPFWSGSDREPWVLHPLEMAALAKLRRERGGFGEEDFSRAEALWQASRAPQRGAADLREVFDRLNAWFENPPAVPDVLPGERPRRAA
ncbi:MAG TPA: hypothetical protein VNI01_08410 [Elusimicrobiota bacterium]|nr:hypothetical protein [Elusimicrobiota bacterium]